jgi:hypothetical protein
VHGSRKLFPVFIDALNLTERGDMRLFFAYLLSRTYRHNEIDINILYITVAYCLYHLAFGSLQYGAGTVSMLIIVILRIYSKYRYITKNTRGLFI